MTAPLIHPRTGHPIRPLGYRRDGRPVWPVLGGSEPTGDQSPADQPADEPKPEDKPDTGKPADVTADTEKWKALARKHEADAKANKAAAARLAEIEAAQQSDMEKAVAAARKETEDAVRSEVRRERVLDRIEVLAAKDFADPEDARLRLGQRADEFVGDDGTVDAKAIAAALADLLKNKPHLAAAQPDGRPRGNADIGARDTAPKRAQSLEDAVMARVAPPR